MNYIKIKRILQSISGPLLIVGTWEGMINFADLVILYMGILYDSMFVIRFFLVYLYTFILLNSTNYVTK